jgi:uncharacterized protein YlxP (DUF503 family)
VEAFVGLLTITYEILGAEGLKDKRRILHSLVDRARRLRKVSICEVGFQNRARSAIIAAAIVGPNKRTVERERSVLESLLCNSPEAEPIEVVWEWL